jgi:WD40 repeat protein
MYFLVSFFLFVVVASKTINVSVPMGHRGKFTIFAFNLSSFDHFSPFSVVLEIVYSLRLYDPDLDEEIWIDEAAHHGTIYDIKWSKNDRFLLTCSNDGTCKIWDLLAAHPVMHQYSPPPMGDDDTLTVLNNSAEQIMHSPTGLNSLPGALGRNVRSPPPQQSQQPHVVPEHHADDHSLDLSYLPNYLNPRNLSKMFPPRVYCIFRLPSKVYTHCGIFQEFSSSTSSTGGGGAADASELIWNQVLDYNTWKEAITKIQNAPLPRVILGCSDGKLRVYDFHHSLETLHHRHPHPHHHNIPSSHTSNYFVGYISVRDKDEHGNVIDIPPHNGTVNSLVLDERSR